MGAVLSFAERRRGGGFYCGHQAFLPLCEAREGSSLWALQSAGELYLADARLDLNGTRLR
jgi:hypothetical protein